MTTPPDLGTAMGLRKRDISEARALAEYLEAEGLEANAKLIKRLIKALSKLTSQEPRK